MKIIGNIFLSISTLLIVDSTIEREIFSLICIDSQFD